MAVVVTGMLIEVWNGGDGNMDHGTGEDDDDGDSLITAEMATVMLTAMVGMSNC